MVEQLRQLDGTCGSASALIVVAPVAVQQRDDGGGSNACTGNLLLPG